MQEKRRVWFGSVRFRFLYRCIFKSCDIAIVEGELNVAGMRIACKCLFGQPEKKNPFRGKVKIDVKIANMVDKCGLEFCSSGVL